MLAMKAETVLFMHKLRIHHRYESYYTIKVIVLYAEDANALIITCNRWMKWRISFGGKGNQQTIAKELVGPKLTAGTGTFSFSMEGARDEITKAPIAYIPDLLTEVTQLLDQNNNNIIIQDRRG